MEPPASPADEHVAGRDYGALLADAERVLDEVDRALARLDDGTYGTCEVCGETVGDDVLEATPTARTCQSHLPLAAGYGPSVPTGITATPSSRT